MRLILGITYVEVEQLVGVARAAEELGFDGVALADHVAIPGQHASTHTLEEAGRPLFNPCGPWPDALVAIAAMAAATTRLRFLTRVVVLPLHHPLALARATATLAAISGGRLQLGVGVGWLREEFDQLGADWEHRGARADETIVILRKAWLGPFEHSGRFYQLAPVEVSPRPPAPVPIYVGGDSRLALGRAARLGDGYLSRSSDPGRMAEEMADLSSLRGELGREGEFDYVARADQAWTSDDFARAESAGATSALVVPWGPAGPSGPIGGKRALLERFLEGMR
jgi:probable F420-dependent oxidoreductase